MDVWTVIFCVCFKYFLIWRTPPDCGNETSNCQQYTKRLQEAKNIKVAMLTRGGWPANIAVHPKLLLLPFKTDYFPPLWVKNINLRTYLTHAYRQSNGQADIFHGIFFKCIITKCILLPWYMVSFLLVVRGFFLFFKCVLRDRFSLARCRDMPYCSGHDTWSK